MCNSSVISWVFVILFFPIEDSWEIQFYMSISYLLLEINRFVGFKTIGDHYD